MWLPCHAEGADRRMKYLLPNRSPRVGDASTPPRSAQHDRAMRDLPKDHHAYATIQGASKTLHSASKRVPAIGSRSTELTSFSAM